MAAKYTRDESDKSDEIDKLASGVSHISLPVTVLSWNIFGATKKGMAKARKEMLKSNIGYFNPDVMLLQETKTSIDEFFRATGIPEKEYKYPKEAIKNKEARVIYKASEFEKVEEPTVDEGFLDTILANVFPENETIETKSKKVGGRETIKDRICLSHLRHKSSRCEIIFVSYHNIYRGKHSTDMASKFCKIIAEIHESSKRCVIAGVDFNTDNFDEKHVEVPGYEVTPRREKKKKVDFFILSNSTANWEVESVKSSDLFSGDKAPIHKNVQSPSASFTKDQYYMALDHDPLVLYLVRKGDGEEEDEGESEKEKVKKEKVLPRLKAPNPDHLLLSLKAVKIEEEEEEEGDEESEKEMAKKEKLATRLKTN